MLAALRPGDRPVVCVCGRCAWCGAGNARVCPDQEQPGFTHWGSFAEYVGLHAMDTNLVALSATVDYSTAASLGGRFATAYRALAERARVTEGEWVTVVGAGGVELSAVMIARALGARIVAVDRNPAPLAVAAELGAEHTLLAGGIDVPAEIADLTGGGSQVAVDAVGSEQTCATAIHSLRRHGRHIQDGLLPPVDGHPAMMALIERGTLRPQRLIERTIGLDEAAALFPGFDRATVAGMILIDPHRT